MAGRARIRNTGLLSLSWCDETKRVSTHIVFFYRLLNLRHVARDALAPLATRRMVRVFTHRSL